MRNEQHLPQASRRGTKRAKRDVRPASLGGVSEDRGGEHSGAVSRLTEVANPMLVGRVADTTAQRDREALDSSVVGLLQEFLDARSVCLYRVDESENRLARRAFVQRDDGAPPQETEANTRVFPIEERSQIIGRLDVVSDTPITARDAALVQGMLRVLRNQLALLDYGERDTLTGLLNRKTFETRFQKLTALLRAQASGARAGDSWLGLLDIDHFKSINDRHGHLFGDEVLLIVSQIMKRTFRGADELFRFGGEEFVILLEETDEYGARIAFERLRAAVESHVFPQACQVTVSVGHTRITSRDVAATAIERADGALYHVKRNGRNGARQYEALIESGLLEQKEREGEIELF
jgi:diguanylate cyclase (GGDEF)-like protein